MIASNSPSAEQPAPAMNGWGRLLILFFASTYILWTVVLEFQLPKPQFFPIIGSILGFVAVMIGVGGFFTLQPNQACVLILFGNYKGSVRVPGLHWTIPFYAKSKISLRSRSLKLASRNVIQLDDERRASMVSNLLVVLCGESEVTPVVNAGSLYH